MKFKTDCSFLFFFTRHDWGRWEKKDVSMTRLTHHRNGTVTTIPYTQTIQERVCKNCFLSEIQKINF